jgi:hypothetical protein
LGSKFSAANELREGFLFVSEAIKWGIVVSRWSLVNSIKLKEIWLGSVAGKGASVHKMAKKWGDLRKKKA